MTSFGQQNQNRNMGRQPQRLLSETARCLTRAYGTHSTQCTSITIDQTLQTEIRLSAASSVNKQACSCETPAKKAPTKPDNRLCPSTKVQLGKQEWLALANVRKTTCKFPTPKWTQNIVQNHYYAEILTILAQRFRATRKRDGKTRVFSAWSRPEGPAPNELK